MFGSLAHVHPLQEQIRAGQQPRYVCQVRTGRTNQRAAFGVEEELAIEKTNLRAFGKEEELAIERTNQKVICLAETEFPTSITSSGDQSESRILF